MRTIRTPRRSAAAGAVLCALGVGPFAQAQTAPGEAAPTQLDTIIVTGTHARDRTELSSTAPVDVLSAADLRAAAGAEANLAQALASVLPSFSYLDQSNSGSADHVRAAQLRGLNPDQVLVLIDGKRVHPTSIVNVESVVGLGAVAVDFASIPVNAIERVEVLRDGAGAQYGSDAIAGVINVILDHSREKGGALELDTGLYHTHFNPTDRTINDGQTWNLQGKYGLDMGGDGYLHLGVDATAHEPTNRAGFDQYRNPANPNSTLIDYQAGDSRIRNLNLWANSGIPLAGGATGYTVLLFNHRTSNGDAWYREPGDTYNNDPTVHPDGFLPRSTGTNEDLHLSGGMRGPLAPSWNYDGSLTYGRNSFQYGLADSFNASYGAQSPSNFNLGSFRFDQLTANYDVTGDVNLGLAAPSTLALGAEFRKETFNTSAGDPASYLLGSVNPNAAPGSQGDGGLSPGDLSDSARTIEGVYADLSGDVVRNLFVDAGLRFDHYSDAGSATTGKLSARWEFLPHYALRGAVSNNFRAPALAQISSAYSPSSYVANPSVPGTASLSGYLIVPVADPAARALGAQDLKPERSHNLSFGLTAQPIPQLQVSADLFRIDIDDRIVLSQQVTIPDPATGLPAALVPGATYQFFTNALDTSTKGAELVAGWASQLAGGTLHLSDASTWVSNTIRGIHNPPAAFAALGGALVGPQSISTVTVSVPKRRDVVTVNWANPTWSFLLRGTHTGEVTRVFDWGAYQTYGATFQLDAEAEMHVTRDLALALGAQNLGDRYPTQSNSDINNGGNLPYDFLSPIGFNGRYLYLRVRYALH